MTLTMIDSDENGVYAGLAVSAYAGYVDGHVGNQPNYQYLVNTFPHAKHLSITVLNNKAMCADVETGAMSKADIYGWIKSGKAVKPGPYIYTSASNVDSVVTTMAANGFARTSYKIWSAHYGSGEHICGPHSCGLTKTAVDGTQWTNSYLGRHLDASILSDNFFGDIMPFKITTPPPGTWEGLVQATGVGTDGKPYLFVTTDGKTWTGGGPAAA